MKTQVSVVDKVYPILNVSAVTDLLTGRVNRYKKPRGRQLKDIVLHPLPISGNKGTDLQTGTLVINTYAKNDTKTGIPDEVSLKAIAVAIIAVLEAYSASSDYFSFNIISENFFSDELDDAMTYDSIRINYTIEKGE